MKMKQMNVHYNINKKKLCACAVGQVQYFQFDAVFLCHRLLPLIYV